VKYLILALVSVCWSLGGSTFPWFKGDSLWRKIGVPVVLGVYIAIAFNPWWVGIVYGSVLAGMIALGSYGLNATPHKVVGYIFKLIGYDNKQVDTGKCRPCEVVTRGFCGLIWSLASIVLAINGLMPVWVLYGLICTIGVGVAGGLIRKAVISELVVGALVGSIVLFL